MYNTLHGVLKGEMKGMVWSTVNEMRSNQELEGKEEENIEKTRPRPKEEDDNIWERVPRNPQEEERTRPRSNRNEDEDNRIWGRVTHNLQSRIPIFSFGGTVQPHEWVHKLKGALKYIRTHDEMEKIDIAMQHLEGPAHTWAARWEEREYSEGVTTIENFTQDFLKRTEGPNPIPFNVQIANLKQREMTVEEYTEKFQNLESKCTLSEKEALDFYIHNMRRELSAELLMWKPANLERAYSLAIRVEEKVNSLRRRLNPAPRRTFGNETNKKNQKEGDQTKEKWQKGKCRRCSEDWSPGHKCNPRSFNMAIDEKESDIEEDSDLEEDENQEMPTEIEDNHLECQIDTDDPQVSLAAMTGLRRLDMFKTFGMMRKNKVLVMVDPGSTLNIMDKGVAKRLGFHVDNSERFPISVPGHNQITCEGVVRKVELQMGDYTLRGPFYVTSIGGVDVVLGVQWLITLGTYSTNHQKGFLRFRQKGQKYTINAIEPKESKVVSSEQMDKIIRKGHFGFIARLYTMEGPITEIKEQPPEEIHRVLVKHQSIFQKLPQGMPPNRGHEHIIELDPTKGPTMVRPYRYNYRQKSEIERLIFELLELGVITESKSPYAAPVVLA